MDAVLFGVEALQQLGGAELVAFDSETTGLKAERGGLRLCQFAAEGLPAVVVDCWELDEEGWDVLRGFFATKRRWVAHNAVFDLTWLQEHDCYPEGEVFCTMLASRLLENGIPNVRNGLDVVCQRYLGREVDKTQQRSDWSVPVLSQEQLVYAADDVKVLLPLFAHVNERLRKAALQRAWVLECRAMPAIAQMQRTGIPFSRSKLEQLKSFYVEEIERLGAEFVKQLDEALPDAAKLPRLADGTYNLNAKASGSIRLGTKVQAGFNLNSPKQLIDKLGAVLGEVPKDATGKPSASRKALRTYAADHVVVQTYLAWKRAEKRRQMVVALLEHQDADGRIRANYLQLGADTGRMSCVSGDTVLITSRGDFTFAEYTPQLGDRVLTHVGRWMPVVRKLYRGVEPVTEVVTAEGGRLCCTGDHKLWTGRAWVRVSDLSVGDTLGLFKEVGSAAGKRGGGTGRVPQRAEADCVPSGRNDRDDVPQRYSRTEGKLIAGKAESRKGATAIQGKDRFLKPYEGQVWFPAPQLRRWSRGSQRLFDRAGREGRTSISAQTCYGAGSGLRETAAAPTRTPHQWRHTGQQVGQLGAGDIQRSQRFTSSTTVVESLKPLGPVGVWDVEVEGDHSYALYGFLSHNCNSPNLQQVPRDKGFREAAEAPEGWCFVVADFGQMELRLAAAISGDRRMTEAFQRGEDLHDITAKALYPEVSDDPAVNKQRRQIAKSANFGLLYGSGAQGLREYAGSMGITMSLEEAQLIRETFHQTYSGIAKWQRGNAATADKTRADKWAEVRIPGSGMRRYLMGDMNRLTTRSNTPVQGAGAAVLKRALGKLWPLVRASGEDCARLSATVHDEVLVLVREGHELEWCETLSDVMESAEAEWLGDIPPLAEAAYGPTWQAAK